MKTLAEMLSDNFANANSLRQQAKHEVDKLHKALEKATEELDHYSRLSDQLARIIEDYVKPPASDRGIRGYNSANSPHLSSEYRLDSVHPDR